MPGLIQRVDSNARAASNPAFRILFVPDGLMTRAERLTAAEEAWVKLRDIAPFQLIYNSNHAAARAFAVYCWIDTMPTLEVVQSGKELSIPIANATSLRDALSDIDIPDAAPVTPPLKAGTVWPVDGSGGRFGSLVVVLKQGSTAGEMYHLASSSRYPVPLVGVVQADGVPYAQVIARAIGQQYLGLADEFETDGPEKPVIDDETIQPPNLLLVNDADRARLADTELRKNVDLRNLTEWPLTASMLEFVPHPHPATPDKAPARRRGDFRLVEGGGGWRSNAFRADVDCIMRRDPESTTPDMQTPAEFCHVCKKWLQRALAGTATFNVESPGRVEMHSQLMKFDRIKWKVSDKILRPSDAAFKPTMMVAGTPDPDAANWTFTAKLDSADGLVLENLLLQNRNKHYDPFYKAESVAKKIEFKDLQVRYRLGGGQEQSYPLSFSAAFAQPGGVSIQVCKDGNDYFQAGVKAVFAWTVPGLMKVEAQAGMVVRGTHNDIEPGGVITACKWMPQLAMRWWRIPRSGQKLKVEGLDGKIVFEMNNNVPVGLELPIGAPQHIKDFRRGKVSAGLFTDSNSSRYDNVYDFLPPFHWVKGRKLSLATTLRAGTARLAYLKGLAPLVPLWSWLFDYAIPNIGSTEKRTVAVGNAGNRSLTWPWPPPDKQTGSLRDYEMEVVKLPRQGGFDNAHVSADHGGDHDGHEHGDPNHGLTAAPFCADMCNHLHWRWGTMAQSFPREKEAFYGWGTGKAGQGANRVPGAPLVPPNQRIELVVSVATGADEGKSATFKYEVRAEKPREGELQVFLEQGIGFAFAYKPILYLLAKPLAAALGLTPPDLGVPQQLDYNLREFFDRVYARLKFYKADADDTVQHLLQTPYVVGADGLFVAPGELETL